MIQQYLRSTNAANGSCICFCCPPSQNEELEVVPALEKEGNRLRAALAEEQAEREDELHLKDGEIGMLKAKVMYTVVIANAYMPPFGFCFGHRHCCRETSLSEHCTLLLSEVCTIAWLYNAPSFQYLESSYGKAKLHGYLPTSRGLATAEVHALSQASSS